MPDRKGYAIVIGASISGLLAARVLSNHFHRVTVLERDKVADFPQVRKGQPQAKHTHVLLAKGLEIISRYCPRLLENLTLGGAPLGDLAKDLRWFVDGLYRLQFSSGIPIVFVSRPFIEFHLREEILSIPNIALIDCANACHLKMAAASDKIEGVFFTQASSGQIRELLVADLVVDASGRSRVTSTWLESLGFSPPRKSEVKVDVGYSTKVYKRHPDNTGGLIISPSPPKNRYLGVAFPMENEQLIVGLAGWGGDYPPTDEDGFLEFARTLPSGDIYHSISKLEPVSNICSYRVPSSVHCHYEKLKRNPERLISLGDSFMSFNPVYGQGMTSAAIQAEVLDLVLKNTHDLNKVNIDFYRIAAKKLRIPWKLATTEDFRFPTTTGDWQWDTKLLNLFTSRVHRATCLNTEICKVFLETANLLEPPKKLLHPRIISRIIFPNFPI